MPSPIANNVAKMAAPAEPARKSPEPKEGDAFRDVLQDAQRKPEPRDQQATPKAETQPRAPRATKKAGAKGSRDKAAGEPVDEGIVAEPAPSAVDSEVVELATEVPVAGQIQQLIPESLPDVETVEDVEEVNASPVVAVVLPVQQDKPVEPSPKAELEAADALTASPPVSPKSAPVTELPTRATTDQETPEQTHAAEQVTEAEVQLPRTEENPAPKRAVEPVAAKTQMPEMPALPHASSDAGAQKDDQPQRDPAAKNPEQADMSRVREIRQFHVQDKAAAVATVPQEARNDVQPPNPLHIDARPAAVESLKQPSAQPALRELEFARDNHERIITAVRTQLLPRGGTMQLRIDPPDLGMLQIAVRMQDGTLSVAFQTSSEETTKLLSNSLAQLKHGLETQGVSVDRIHVQQAPQDESSGRNDGDSQQRHSLQDEASARQEQQRKEMLRRMWRRLALGSDPLDLVA